MNITELIERLREWPTGLDLTDIDKAVEALLAQQVCIEQMREAVKNSTEHWNGHPEYERVASLQPDLSALREHDAEVVAQCYYVVRGAPLSVDGVALTALQVLSIYDQLTLPLRTMVERRRGIFL